MVRARLVAVLVPALLGVGWGCTQGTPSSDVRLGNAAVAEAGMSQPPAPVPSSSTTPPIDRCAAFASLGPFAAPEQACPALLAVCTDSKVSCKCIRHRDLEKPAGPFEAASVLEVSSTRVVPHAFALAVQSAGRWYVASHYPHFASIEGGIETFGVKVIRAPRIQVETLPVAGGIEAAVLSIERGDCRWKKSEPARASVNRLVGGGACDRADMVLGRHDAQACALGPSLRPSCTGDYLDFEPPPGDRMCQGGLFP
jgi:hypothetical protein